MLIKALFIITGAISLSIGIIGIFVPGLPTTVFLLITAYMWARSSEKLYNKLLNHKYLGKIITNFHKNKGMTLRSKIYSISIMWVMIFISTYFLVQNQTIDIILLLAGLTGTIVMGFILRTLPHDPLDN